MALDVCRSNELIVTPAGRKIYPSYFVHLLDGYSGIDQFQFEQTRADRILLRLCATGEVVAAVGPSLESRLQVDLGRDMVLQVERVLTIPRSRSGKHRSVIGMAAEC